MNYEKINTYEHQPHRIESRLSIDSNALEEVTTFLRSNFEPKLHDNPWTRTLYFAAPDLSTPSTILRCRQYTNEPAVGKMFLNPDEIWWLETKTNDRDKERLSMQLGDILVGVSYPELEFYNDTFTGVQEIMKDFKKPLLPIAATESHRSHFIGDGMRITLDDTLEYYGFIWGENQGELIGKQPYAKLEMKVENPSAAKCGEEKFKELGEYPFSTELSDGQHEKELRKLYGAFLTNHERTV